MPVTNPFRVAGIAVFLTAVALLATSATASASACPGASSQRLSKAESARTVFCLVNQERAQRGLATLRSNGRLAKVARVHARDMVRYRFMSHNSPARGGLLRRVKRSGYARNRGFSVGEIMGYGERRSATPRRIVREWMRHSIHRTAILYRSFRHMGVGVAKGTPRRGRGGRSFVITFGS